MQGLIYRELHLARKTLGTCLLVYIMFTFLTNLYALSIRIGNVAKYCTAEEISYQLGVVPIVALFGYVILLVTAPEAILQVMDGDFKTTWLEFALSSPKTIREQIGAKYLAYLIMTVCAIVLGWLNIMITCGISGQGIPGGMFPLFLACALAVMTITALFMPIAFYKQNINIINVLLMIPLVVMTFGLSLSCLSFFKENQDAKPIDYVLGFSEKITALSGTPVLDALKIFAPFIEILLITASFFLSVRILDKRRLVKGSNVREAKKKGGRL